MNKSLRYLAGLTLLAFSVEASVMASPISDPIGDTFGNEPIQLDISAIDAIFNQTNITFKISFARPIAPPSAFAPNSAVGYIDIDADRHENTGVVSAQTVFGLPPSSGLGMEFLVDIVSERSSPGFVDIVKPFSPFPGEVVGSAPILFTSTSLSVTIPLELLDNDDGLVNYGTVVGTFSEATDEAPNAPVATSRSVAEPSSIVSLLGFGLLLGSRRHYQ
jgi:serralysin